MSTLPVADPPRRHRGLIVLDFDGTLWRGDEPLEAYAAATAASLPAPVRPAYLGRVRAFLSGDRWRAPGPGPLPADGWAAVARFAEDLGVTEEQRQAAFLATREGIARGDFRLEVPAGLAEAIAWSRAWCAVVLASNSPPTSVLPVLERLGLSGLFDDVSCGAGKPDGLTALVEAWADRFEVGPGRIMSIGDHYANDIAPAVAAGWSTAYITPWRAVAGPCSIVGATVEEMLPTLRAWVEMVAADAQPQAFGDRGDHHGSHHRGRERSATA